MQSNLYSLVEKLGMQLSQKKWVLATAESCTGGAIGAALTSVSGSSQWYNGGIISYSNSLKQSLLGVSLEDITTYGAVSEPVVMAMVTGCITQTHSNIGVAVSGIAGPLGGTKDKPVGTVCIGWGSLNNAQVATVQFDGTREQIRDAATLYAIERVLDFTYKNSPSGCVEHGIASK